MENLSQRTIEYFFEKFGITDQEVKAKLLPEVTGIIYDYNMHIVKYEQEADEYHREQILVGIRELEEKIEEIFKEVNNK